MAKTLVINGANFTENKLTTVEFSDVPCTGISFESDSYSASALGALTVTYTKTPADATDDVIFSSSDENVVIATADGFEVVGIGSCTITVTCGNYSDTATVTVTIACIPAYEFSIYTANENGYIGTTRENNYSRLSAMGSGEQASNYVLYGPHVSAYPRAIKFPKNTAKIRISITAPLMFNADAASIVIWGKDEASGYSSYPNAIKLVSAEDPYAIRSNTTKEFSVPSGADCFVFTTKLQTTYTSEDDPNTVATSAGLQFEFLPPAE